MAELDSKSTDIRPRVHDSESLAIGDWRLARTGRAGEIRANAMCMQLPVRVRVHGSSGAPRTYLPWSRRLSPKQHWQCALRSVIALGGECQRTLWGRPTRARWAWRRSAPIGTRDPN